MIDKDLKKLFDEIAKSQAKVVAAQIESEKRQKEADKQQVEAGKRQVETEKRLDKRLEALSVQVDKTSKEVANTSKKVASLSETVANTNKTVDKTTRSVDRLSKEIAQLSKLYGNFSNNEGRATEDLFYNSLRDNPVVCGIRFDEVERNWYMSYQGVKGEFDLILINGKIVFILEIKRVANFEHIDLILNKKKLAFEHLFPKYAGYKKYFGLATMVIDDKLKKQFIQAGITVLQNKGGTLETCAAI